jgi:hypothetical protein
MSSHQVRMQELQFAGSAMFRRWRAGGSDVAIPFPLVAAQTERGGGS